LVSNEAPAQAFTIYLSPYIACLPFQVGGEYLSVGRNPFKNGNYFALCPETI